MSGAALELGAVGKNEDALEVRDAVEYLKTIGMRRVSIGTLYNKIARGEGPARFKRNGRWYFKKADLDAWKKQETEGFDAYSK